MSGELTTQQIESIISGKLVDIQQSISGSKELITLQIKADLGQEYQKIIENANSGIANQLSRLLWVTGGVFIVIGGFVSRSVNKMKNDVNKIKKEIENKEKTIEELEEKISKKQKELEEFIKSKEGELYTTVIQKIVDWHFERIEKFPDDIGNLFGLLATYDKYYIKPAHGKILSDGISLLIKKGQPNKNETINESLQSFCLLLYQYFPSYYNIIPTHLRNDIIFKWAYSAESEDSTREIIKHFKDTGEDINSFKNYLKTIYEHTHRETEDRISRTSLISLIDQQLGKKLEKFNSTHYQNKTGEWAIEETSIEK